VANADSSTPVGELVTQWPGAAKVFARHGIDFCCGGGKSLEAACAERALPTQTVLDELAEAQAPSDEPNWAEMELAQMCDELERRYHRPLDEEMPRLEALAEKVARVHGDNHPELRDLARVFAGLVSELTNHMMKEEQVLFPMIRARGAAPPPPIQVMRHEHDEAGAALREMRKLGADYRPPDDACNSYRALMEGLAELEHDLHMHIHVENNVLFPRALS
jgi:regulator of cell morphogenesis and NO signaling